MCGVCGVGGRRMKTGASLPDTSDSVSPAPIPAGNVYLSRLGEKIYNVSTTGRRKSNTHQAMRSVLWLELGVAQSNDRSKLEQRLKEENVLTTNRFLYKQQHTHTHTKLVIFKL